MSILGLDGGKMKEIKFIDLFCGIGGFRIAAEEVFKVNEFIPKCVFSSDIDLYAQESYSSNFGDYPKGDITKISEYDIPDHDILFAGFPCQPFSIIGMGRGFKDARGTLFFDIARIINAKRPKAFLLENVKQLASHQNGKTLTTILNILKDLGYHVDWRILNALDYGLPQKRERIFIVGYERFIEYQWPSKTNKIASLSGVLEKHIDKKYIASEHIQVKRKRNHTPSITPSIWHENKAGNVSSYPYSCALRAGASYNYLLVNGERRFTPREMLRLQGFPDSYKVVVPDSQIRKQAGNAVPVNLVRSVLWSLMPFLKNDLEEKENVRKCLNDRTKEIPAFAHSR